MLLMFRVDYYYSCKEGFDYYYFDVKKKKKTKVSFKEVTLKLK